MCSCHQQGILIASQMESEAEKNDCILALRLHLLHFDGLLETTISRRIATPNEKIHCQICSFFKLFAQTIMYTINKHKKITYTWSLRITENINSKILRTLMFFPVWRRQCELVIGINRFREMSDQKISQPQLKSKCQVLETHKVYVSQKSWRGYAQLEVQPIWIHSKSFLGNFFKDLQITMCKHSTENTVHLFIGLLHYIYL